jgi:AcrR family transcriptional regulator
VRDVIRRTDLASGTFYNYFADKESVLRALVEETAAEARARVRAARRRGTTLEAFVRDGFEAYFGYLVEDRETTELVARNAGTIRAMFDEPALAAGLEELEQDLRDGIAAGMVPDHDAGMMATAMVGAAFEVGARLLEEDDPDVSAAVAFLSTVFAAGLRELALRPR